MRVGYVMLLPQEQTLDVQREALVAAHCGTIFTDTLQNGLTKRNGLDDALASLSPGDTLVVWKLDRLGRSQRRLLDIIAALQQKQSGLISLTEDFTMTPANDTVVIQHIGALATIPRSPARAGIATEHTSHSQHSHHKTNTLLYGGLAVLFVFLLAIVSFTLPSYDNYTGKITNVHVNGRDTVTAIVDETVTVLITSGNLNGKQHTIDYKYSTVLNNNEAAVGDSVLLGYDARTQQIFINGYDRRGLTFALVLIFLSLTVLIARQQGVMSLLGMLVSIFVIMLFVVPSILRGNDPLVSAMLAALVIIPATYYLAHGWNRKTTVAIIATFATLILTTLLAYIFTHLMKIPDALSDEIQQGYYTSQGTLVNLQSFYLAALVVGALAVLNDITISQASIVTSLVRSNPSLAFGEIVTHAMSVGKDHIASLINTLLLVYIGAALPQFLTFIENHYDISNPFVSIEIVRIVVPSIGIVAAVPIATVIAAYFATHHIHTIAQH